MTMIATVSTSQLPPPPPRDRADIETRMSKAMQGVADLLGTTVDEIREAQRDGTSLAELAAEKGVSGETLTSTLAQGLKANAPSDAPKGVDVFERRRRRELLARSPRVRHQRQSLFQEHFPAAYSGRWPHIHFEIYKDLATAVSSGAIKKTSQLALPKDICDAVYATSGYSRSVSNMAGTTLATDNVFRDDRAASQLATVTGSVGAGYVASLNVLV